MWFDQMQQSGVTINASPPPTKKRKRTLKQKVAVASTSDEEEEEEPKKKVKNGPRRKRKHREEEVEKMRKKLKALHISPAQLELELTSQRTNIIVGIIGIDIGANKSEEGNFGINFFCWNLTKHKFYIVEALVLSLPHCTGDKDASLGEMTTEDIHDYTREMLKLHCSDEKLAKYNVRHVGVENQPVRVTQGNRVKKANHRLLHISHIAFEFFKSKQEAEQNKILSVSYISPKLKWKAEWLTKYGISTLIKRNHKERKELSREVCVLHQLTHQIYSTAATQEAFLVADDTADRADAFLIAFETCERFAPFYSVLIK